MSADSDRIFDIYECLGRIEGKLDQVAGNQNKTTLALIGIIAAQLGLEFKPNSPIDWLTGLNNSLFYLTIFTLVFVSLRMIQTRKQTMRSRFFNWLAGGFLGLSSALTIIMLCGGHVGHTVPPWLLVPLRVFYIFAFTYYGWNIERVNGIKNYNGSDDAREAKT